MKQSALEVGRIYFGITYEDDDLTYPIVHSYEYLGLSKRRPTVHEFRCLGSNDSYLVTDDELEFISSTNEIVLLLQEWAIRNPRLSTREQ